jgi:hypothetical protein
MSMERSITFADLTSAREHRDPKFAELVIAYLEQPDPPETATGRKIPPEENSEAAWLDDDADDELFDDDDDTDDDEDAWDDDGDDDTDIDDDADIGPALDETRDQPPRDAWTLARLRSALASQSASGKTPEELRALREEAWGALLAAPLPPPRLFLGDMLRDIYGEGTDWARTSLIEIFRLARLGWGIWKAFKHIYKRAEELHDTEMFGILAWRLDAIHHTPYHAGEIGAGTLAYMRRRAWRYMRQLGQAVPELYPQLAVQVLRHYPAGFWFSGSWIANQIWAHKDLIGARSASQSEPPAKLDRRAFHEAWKLSPDPLLRLLEDAANDTVCEFAIRCLRADFGETLRRLDPRWLARIGQKTLPSLHELVVDVLEGNPEMHPSAFRSLGLHDMVLGLLRSESEKAAAYAVEYAKAHAPDIPVDMLIEVAEAGTNAARALAEARLAKLSPAALGLPTLIRMLAVDELEKLAARKIEEGFRPADLTAELYVALATGTDEQQEFVQKLYKKHSQPVPAAFLRALVEHPELSSWQRRRVLQELGKRKAVDIGVEWIKDGLLDPRFSSNVSEWLRAGMLAGDALDVEWLKGLALRPRLRELALELLGNPKLVAPHRIGLPWLLAMARQSDPALSAFAHRYLLEHFAPDDFAQDAGTGKDAKEAGIAKIWSLIQPGQPEPVRRFAAAYLRVHHPEIGPGTDEAKSLGIKPRLPRASYTLARVRPLFDDGQAEVRRLARDIGRQELVRWNEPHVLYELARSRFREGRALAAEALLHIGEPDADPKAVPPVSWLNAGQVFALAESPVKATREIALTLVRRHYERLGGVERLGWLMESPDREVRLFAVRLLWERHRPLPHAKAAGPTGTAHARFSSTEALQQFLRTVLLGLPPGRMERRESADDALPDRPLPASRAKRALIDVVRDMAVEDAGFAAVIVPVLEEMMHSRAKGEWQACVAALARIRRAHPTLAVHLPPAVLPAARTA